MPWTWLYVTAFCILQMFGYIEPILSRSENMNVRVMSKPAARSGTREGRSCDHDSQYG